MSDTNRVSLGYMLESTFGTIPAATDLEEVRYTSESLTSDTSSTVSAEIRSDRQNTDVIRTNVTAGGDINCELSYGAHDVFMQAVLGGTWSSALAISASTISSTAGSPATIADSGNGLGSIQVGQWIKVGGFTATANNTWWRVLSVTAGSITVEDDGGVMVTESAGNTITIDGSTLINGVVERSFVFEKNFSDASEFTNFVGMRAGTWSLNVAPDAVITQTFGFMGKAEDATGATVSSGTTNAATTNEVMNAIDDVYTIREGTADSTLCFSEISFSVENALRNINCIGSLGPNDIGYGSFQVTGNLNAYFESRTLFEKYLDWTTSALSFRTEDGSGNAYVFTFPAVKYTSGEVVAGGKDQDVMVNLSWTAFLDSTTGITMRVDRA